MTEWFPKIYARFRHEQNLKYFVKCNIFVYFKLYKMHVIQILYACLFYVCLFSFLCKIILNFVEIPTFPDFIVLIFQTSS